MTKMHGPGILPREKGTEAHLPAPRTPEPVHSPAKGSGTGQQEEKAEW